MNDDLDEMTAEMLPMQYVSDKHIGHLGHKSVNQLSNNIQYADDYGYQNMRSHLSEVIMFCHRIVDRLPNYVSRTKLIIVLT